jgi:hypothetical protein
MAKKVKKQLPSEQQKVPGPELRIMAQPEVAKGVYSNLAIIQHMQNEFVIDFLFKITAEGQLVSRVVLSPQHAIALLDALKININKYEAKFGKIESKPQIS